MPISLYLLYLKSIKSIKNVCARIFDVYKSSFLTIYGELCRPNRAAFLPPQSPQWGDETSLIFTDYRQAKIFRLIGGESVGLFLQTSSRLNKLCFWQLVLG